MSVTVRGMDEWLDILKTLPERAPKAFRPVMSKAGANMKDDWKARWQGMPHQHIPHLVRHIGYDLSDHDFAFTVETGVTKGLPQSRLASFIEYGTLTSGPHPAGEPALRTEAPKMAQWAEQVAEDLLTGAA